MKKVAIIGLSGNSLFYSLDNIPSVGETVKAKTFHMEVGGKGFNQAVACKRLGLDVYYLSAIGNDSYGKDCISFMEKEGINHKYVIKDVPTASATILNDNESNNEVIVYHGANEKLSVDDVIGFEDVIRNVDCVLLNYEIPYDALKKAVEISKKYNKLLIINPAPYIYDDLALLREADYVTPNEVELSQMYCENINRFEDIENAYRDLMFKNLVVTLGSKGSYICDDNGFRHIEAFKVNSVDSTGAGDVYNAAFCYSILMGNSIDEACNFASLASSKSVEKKFVMDAIPYINEIK